jgi:hypothetical protein
MTAISILIGLFAFLWLPMLSHAKSPDGSVRTDYAAEYSEMPGYCGLSEQRLTGGDARKDSMLISRLGNTRIVFKDGSIRKNCKVKEINAYWIIYEKDGSLHDLMIEKIRRIEICDGTMQAIFFNEKNKPEIGTYVY